MLFFAVGAVLIWILTIKAKKLYKAKTRGVRISGTVQSSREEKIPFIKGTEIMKLENVATVEFDAAELLRKGISSDCSSAEVITGKTVFQAGETISCFYMPDTKEFIPKRAFMTIDGIAAGYIISLLFIYFPISTLLMALGILNPGDSLAFIFVFFASACYCASIAGLVSLIMILKDGKPIILEGKITGYEKTTSDGDTAYEYEYTVSYNGKTYRSMPYNSYKHYMRAPEIGAPVTVYFNERTGEFSDRSNSRAAMTTCIGFLLIGIVMTIAAIACFSIL